MCAVPVGDVVNAGIVGKALKHERDRQPGILEDQIAVMPRGPRLERYILWHIPSSRVPSRWWHTPLTFSRFGYNGNHSGTVGKDKGLHVAFDLEEFAERREPVNHSLRMLKNCAPASPSQHST